MSEGTPDSKPRPPRRLPAWLGAFAFTLALIAAAALGWWLGNLRGGAETVTAGDASSAAEVLAELRLPTVDGQLLGPRDLDADAVVLDFWATWCTPCVVQEEILRALEEEYAHRGIAFLGVNMGEDVELVRSYLDGQQPVYPTVLDRDASVSARAGVIGLPTVAVLGPQRELVLFSSGLTGASRIRRALDAVVAEAGAAATGSP